MEIEASRPSAREGAGVEQAAGTGLGHGRHTAVGTLKMLAVQALAMAAGFLIATFLSRQLGPELYGLYAVTAAIVIWVELSVTLMFSSTTVKFLAEAADWQAVASTLAKVMCRNYHETFGQPQHLLPAIVDVSAAEFYGERYDDSDQRIPDITKARTLLGWEPRYGLREALELTMQFYVPEDRTSEVG